MQRQRGFERLALQRLAGGIRGVCSGALGGGRGVWRGIAHEGGAVGVEESHASCQQRGAARGQQLTKSPEASGWNTTASTCADIGWPPRRYHCAVWPADRPSKARAMGESTETKPLSSAASFGQHSEI